MHTRSYSKKSALVAAASVGLFASVSAWGVQTPYSDTPSAVVANDGLEWDNQFASLLGTNAAIDLKTNAQIIFVADFCYSGGFINNLLSTSNTIYAATAANWDETSTGVPTAHGDIALFGQTFMQSSVTKDLGDSFADANTAVNTAQTPEFGTVGNAAAGNLGYTNGDRAIIFSAGDSSSASQQTNFFNDIQTTYNSLINDKQGAGNGGNGWKASAITTLFDQGQTAPNAGNGNTGAAYVNGASTIKNLTAAVASVYTDPTFTNSNKLFIYMNDHGINSDVLKSKVTSNGNGTYHYAYQADVSNYKPTGTGAYGMWDFEISTANLTNADILNFNSGNLPAGWTASVINGGSTIDVRTANPATAATWLTAGTDYNFSFDCARAPAHANWLDYQSTTTAGNYDIFDGGIADSTPWGSGGTVYDTSPAFPGGLTTDPAQWPGWDNGGDGWVEAPVPEPTSAAALLVISTGSILLGRRRQNR